MAMELKTTGVNGFVKPAELTNMETLLNAVNDELLTGKGAGSDFLGWLDLPVNYDKEEFARIKAAAQKIISDTDVFIVIGIGGSYLGARAAIEFLRHSFYNMVSKEVRKTPEIYFVGNNMSARYIKGLIDVVGDRDFSVNVISKSGTTTEPAIAFRIFKEMAEKKYGKEEAAKRAALPHFVVKTGSIMIPSSFKCTNPNAEKIMSCQQYFNENGKLDEAIDVTSTLTLTDGYVRYLVAKYNKLEKVEVVAANGIDIKVGNQVIKFTSDDIRLSYGLGKDDETGEKKFYLSIINGGKRYEIPAEDNEEAATMVKKITNVFDAKIGIAAVSTMNFGLKERLEEAGITVAYT